MASEDKVMWFTEMDPSVGTTHSEQDTALASGNPSRTGCQVHQRGWAPFSRHIPISSSTTSHCLSQGLLFSPTWKQWGEAFPFSACLPNERTLPLKYLELTVLPLSPYPGESVAGLPLLLYSAGMLHWKLLFIPITHFHFTLQRLSCC